MSYLAQVCGRKHKDVVMEWARSKISTPSFLEQTLYFGTALTTCHDVLSGRVGGAPAVDELKNCCSRKPHSELLASAVADVGR